MSSIKQAITPFLWFDTQAEQAANFYLTVFRDSRITRVSRYGEAGPGPAGTVMVVEFELNGQGFLALNGGPHFKITPAVSFVVNCETQDEVDYYWDKLSAGGAKDQCGWLTDRFGVSWQVVPTLLAKLYSDPDPVKSQRFMRAMMQMSKLDIKTLQQAYDGK